MPQERSDALYVKRARKRLGLTQVALADKLGLERRTILFYENSRSELPRTVRLAIRYLLQVHIRKHRRQRAHDL